MKFSLATQDLDADLRALAAADAMPGWVRLRFAREPSFFDGIGVLGHTNQVVALRDGDALVGMGCRSIRRVFIDGQPADFGYLSGLRSIPRVRLATLLARGYRFLRELHTDGRVPGYLTTIVESNRTARAILTSGRAGLPVYLPLGRYHTYALPLRRCTSRNRAIAATVVSGARVGAEALAAFLQSEGPRKQFFPVIRASDFGTPLLRGLRIDDFRVAMAGDTIVGVAAAWDQRGFRQSVVDGYAPAMRMLRPVLNGAGRLAGYRPLPAPGRALNMVYLAFPCVRDNDPTLFAILLEAIRAELVHSDLHFLCVGFHESDALNAVPAACRHLRYDSRLYVVCWGDTRDACHALGAARPPFLELSAL